MAFSPGHAHRLSVSSGAVNSGQTPFAPGYPWGMTFPPSRGGATRLYKKRPTSQTVIMRVKRTLTSLETNSCAARTPAATKMLSDVMVAVEGVKEHNQSPALYSSVLYVRSPVEDGERGHQDGNK